jgi:hypothetical protein
VDFACIRQQFLKELIADSRIWRFSLKARDSRHVEGAVLPKALFRRPFSTPINA